MSSINFIWSTFDVFFNFFFNQFAIVNDVYVGWLFVSAIVMGITINSILNIAKSFINYSEVKKNG